MLGLDLYAVVGVVGAVIVMIAYFGTQAGWLRADDPRCAIANLVGAVLITISLYAAWNLPAFLMEVFWVLISLYGLVRYYRVKQKRF